MDAVRMSAVSVGSTGAEASRRAQLKLIAATMVPAWGRVVVVLVGVAVLVHAVGLGDASGCAVIPGFYIALGPPVGDRLSRVTTVALTGVLVACLTAAGGELSRWTPAVVIGLVVVAFVAGLLPRAGPSAAMHLPLLTAFAYSAAFPLAVASVSATAGAGRGGRSWRRRRGAT